MVTLQLPTKKTKNNKLTKKLKVKQYNKQQSYSGKRLLSNVYANIDAVIEKDNYIALQLVVINHLDYN